MRFSLVLALTGGSLLAGPWQNLIQKDSFQGWRSPSGHTPLGGAWTVRGGVLTVKPFVHRRTDLWTVEEYGDFELEWEWRAARAANSGVKYWVQSAVTLVVEVENEKWHAVPDPRAARAEEITLEYSRGLEYQMADDAHEPDSLLRPDSRAGGLYGLIAPAPETAKPHGRWNRSRLKVHDGRFEHWLNGQRVAAFGLAQVEERMRATRPGATVGRRRSPIALQYHQTEVAFRRMRIRRLN